LRCVLFGKSINNCSKTRACNTAVWFDLSFNILDFARLMEKSTR
jgi:hypothetical protein